MEFAPPFFPVPTSFRACTRCFTRKVKCDGRTPCCSACLKHRADCNITEHVVYSYSTVSQLQNRIHELEALIPANDARNLPQLTPSAEMAAEEVGNLTLGSTSQRYIGGAAGASFAKIFFKQLNLRMDQEADDSAQNIPGSPPSVLSHAGLPSKRIAQHLLSSYILRVHMWWPIFHLSSLRSWLEEMFQTPQACDPFHKYAVFMILALGSREATFDTKYTAMLDVFNPTEYARTALRFFDHTAGGRNLQTLQGTLLLALWMTKSSSGSDNGDLWQIARFAMSTAIELGCHRNNPRWDVLGPERESRNRAWWTCYALERLVAVATGRTLSIRNHAIDAPFPCVTANDRLSPSEEALSTSFTQFGFKPAIHMFRLRSISGDILESVYVARSHLRGNQPQYGETTGIVDGLRDRFATWYAALNEHALSGSGEYLELQIQFSMIVLLLNRPSPSFPDPGTRAIEACVEAAQSAVRAWEALIEEKHLSINWLTFYNTLMTGLTWLYCVWKSSSFESHRIDEFANRIATVIQKVGMSNMSDAKYIRLFQSVRETTIEICRNRSEISQVEPRSPAFDIPLTAEWLDGCFNEVFFSENLSNFNFDFNIDA